MKRGIRFAIVAVLCVCLLSVAAFAASASASFTGPGTVHAGDTIVLTFYLDGTGLYGVSGSIVYDASLLELAETRQEIGEPWTVQFAGNNFLAYDNDLTNPIHQNTALFSVIFVVKNDVSAGTELTVSCIDVTATDIAADAHVGTVTYSATVTTPVSSDNTLKSLTVGNATLSPAFRADITSYAVDVPFDVARLDVQAEANDSNATVRIDNPDLAPGDTTQITVTVTAGDGTQRVYTVTVQRAAAQAEATVPTESSAPAETTAPAESSAPMATEPMASSTEATEPVPTPVGSDDTQDHTAGSMRALPLIAIVCLAVGIAVTRKIRKRFRS